MILYFSGTGNSRHIAQTLAAMLHQETVYINHRLKATDTSPIPVTDSLVLVTPTYAWRIPRVVEDWLRKTAFPGARRIWFVMNCGSEIGNADKYNHRLCEALSLTYMGTTGIRMPENYIAMFSVPEASEAGRIVDEAQPAILKAGKQIEAGLPFPAPQIHLYDRIMSGPVNPAFYYFCVKSRAFTAGDGCIGCGQCEARCPTGNIHMQDGKPVWGSQCTHCMTCICYCPTEAIEYGKKSVGKPRYHIEVTRKTP